MVIRNIEDFCEWCGTDVDHLERSVYKNTDCGAWISWDKNGIEIGSIVEGSDAEFDNSFEFPFESKEVEDWIEELEYLTDEAWREANT